MIRKTPLVEDLEDPMAFPQLMADIASDKDYGIDEIEKAHNEVLETWPHEYAGSFIHIEHPEYTALCPRSGYPDFGNIVLDYVPDGKVCELKAWKLYINSFRDERISHENVINVIADKFVKDVNPAALRIIGDFTRRGGIKTVVTTYRGTNQHYTKYFPKHQNHIL
tara:strand:- start:314 stop:811 length:498 start_codon:yes stop_codon:yes gene_type:complete